MALINCPECGKEISDKAERCPNCGIRIEPLPISSCTYCGSPLRIGREQVSVVNGNKMYHQFGYCDKCMQKWDMDKIRSANRLKCPRCGSPNLQAISDTHGKGASFWKLCFCGLLGLCGTGKTQTDHYWVCQSCGNKFKM